MFYFYPSFHALCFQYSINCFTFSSRSHESLCTLQINIYNKGIQEHLLVIPFTMIMGHVNQYLCVTVFLSSYDSIVSTITRLQVGESWQGQDIFTFSVLTLVLRTISLLYGGCWGVFISVMWSGLTTPSHVVPRLKMRGIIRGLEL